MGNVYVTRKIPGSGIDLLKTVGHEVDVSEKDGVLTRDELLDALGAKKYDAVLCLLTDTIDSKVFESMPSVKIFANYAVGYNNIDTKGATERGITVTNTPGILTETVAEHTMTLLMAISRRIVEADTFTRAGKYDGWAPEMFLGSGLKGKMLCILGAGRIGSRVAFHARKGFEMEIGYYDVVQNEPLESELGAKFYSTVEEALKNADFISVHVPLLDSTRHLIGKSGFSVMKKTAYLINTSRGPVVDESALVDALSSGEIRGAAIDVFENEPDLAPGLIDLSNIIVTPHIASATEETRGKMSEMAAQNIIEFLNGNTPPNKIEII